MGTTREAICEPQSVGSDSSALSEFGHVGSLRRETRSRHEEGVADGTTPPGTAADLARASHLVRRKGRTGQHTFSTGCQAGDDAGCGRSSVSALTIAPCSRSAIAYRTLPRATPTLELD